MKYLYSTLLLLFILSVQKASLLHAQNFYLTGGVNFSKLAQYKEDQALEPNRLLRPGFSIGSTVDLKISEKLSFMPSLLFSLKRETQEINYYLPASFFDENDELGVVNVGYKSSINEFYLDVPLPLKMKLPIGKLDFYGIAGPYLGFFLFESSKTEYDPNLASLETEELQSEPFSNRLDYGIKLGAGLDLKSYLVQVSYDYGLYRKMKYEFEDFDVTQTLRNSFLNFTFAYKL
ncbi:porin family protein [Chondrinema litorale]|uniref:porin family protein n=1 Tax=Chondrinema litorale TaxID=2994555 RepID=UPI0025437B4A|nr:porin family protein [Chondrinema litorale]UZR96706.1 porin family protein [Chondrinema litorale]